MPNWSRLTHDIYSPIVVTYGFAIPVSRVACQIAPRIEGIRSNEMKMRRAVLAALALSVPTTAFAYLDPGTGALLIQGLIGALAVVAVFWWRMKAYVRSLFSRKTKTNSSESAEANAASEKHPDVEQEEIGPKP